MWPADCFQNGDVATLRCIPAVFGNVVDWAVALAGAVAVFFIVLSGIKFLTSGGDPKQVEGARKTLTYTIIGLLIVFLSFAIIKLVGTITGASCIAKPFGFGNC